MSVHLEGSQMIKNYLKIAIRNLKRNLTFSIINILGLTIGLAISFLVLLYVVNEISYDKYHNEADRIYRINSKVNSPVLDEEENSSCVSYPLGTYIVENYPQVLSVVRFSYPFSKVFSIGENIFEEEMYLTDSTLFNVFTIKVLQGDPSQALNHPYSLVITERTAKKFFREENPIGKLIKDGNETYVVRAVIENWPKNSHIKYDVLCSYETIYQFYGAGAMKNWINFGHKTYVKLAKNYFPSELEAEFPGIIEENILSIPFVKKYESQYEFSLQPLSKIHLHSNHLVLNHRGSGETEPGSITTILLFSVIGLFILIIACINFINLNTARSSNRLREVGIRKAVGAYRKQLIGQFLIESIIVSLISLVFAITLAEILLPEFNLIVRQNLEVDYLNQWQIPLSFIILAIFVGIISGSYPAFYLSSFKPISVLYGKLKLGSGSKMFRNSLIVFQFVISIILISSTGVIYKQLYFLKQTDLGFNDENVYVVPLRGRDVRQKIEFFKNELKDKKGISKLSLTSGYPGGNRLGELLFTFEGYEQSTLMNYYNVDYDFLDLLNIKLIQGRNFSKTYSTDNRSIIINETLRKQLNWNEPIGKSIFSSEDGELITYKVIGVVKDFNFQSLHSLIKPLMLKLDDRNHAYILAKNSSQNQQSVIREIENKYEENEPYWPFLGYYLSERNQQLYKTESKAGKMFTYFTSLAVIIASMGLFGLASFTAEQRTKEISIRKILGSSIQSIIQKLSINFLKLVLFASFIAVPISWYLMDEWLQIFAYKINLSWWIFALSVLLAMIIAFITIFYQSLKAASSNPVDAIKYE